MADWSYFTILSMQATTFFSKIL